MKTAYKSIIIIVLVSLLIFVAFPIVTMAQEAPEVECDETYVWHLTAKVKIEIHSECEGSSSWIEEFRGDIKVTRLGNIISGSTEWKPDALNGTISGNSVDFILDDVSLWHLPPFWFATPYVSALRYVGLIAGDKIEGEILPDSYTETCWNDRCEVWDTHTSDWSGTFSVLSLKVKGKEFMITFDDGPLPGKTDNILLQLMNIKVDGEPVKAGFFMVGDNDPYYHSWYDFEWEKGSVKEDPDAVNRVAELGHLIGNHTQHHAWFGWWDYWDPFEPRRVELRMKYNSLKDFVKDEISQCNSEIEKVVSNPPKIFRPPYLYDDPLGEVSKGAKEKEYKIIWGGIADIPFSNNVKKVQLKAKTLLESWKKDEPRVLIFHDNRPATYNYIREIISYLQDEGFTLVHFDPNRIGEEQKKRQALSGQAHSPVDLNIIDPDGLILNKGLNQIPGALYKEFDVDNDGEPDDFFVIPEPKIGNYLIQAIPEVGASPGDVYSLDVEDGQKLITIASNTPISEIPEQPYLVQITDEGIQIIPATIRIEPETLNLASQGEFTAFITLPEGYYVADIDVSTVVCEGAPAVKGMVSEEDSGTYIAKFNRQDLVNVPTGDAVTLKVTGKVHYSDGLASFEGNDTIGVINQGKGKPAPALLTFSLGQSFPNPHNPEAWIPYIIAKDVEVTITIYSSSGRIIRTLQLGYHTAGAYISRDKAAYWDGRNDVGEKVSSGVYFYTIKAGNFTATRKMILLK